MNNSVCLCSIFDSINWVWFVIAVIVAFAIGAVWYSVLFSKAWIRIFKVEIPKKMQPSNMVITLLLQTLATAVFGLGFFVTTSVSVWISILILIGFCAWQKGNLKFRYTKWKEFAMAAIIEAGYTFVIGVVFILFSLI